MGTTERRQRDRARLRVKVLNAARALFAAKGYDAVTMREIAKQIEYSPTAIYSHFKDKDALVHELCAIDFLSLAQAFQKIARVSDPVERLKKIGRAYAEFGLRHPNHYRLMFMTPHPPLDRAKKDLEKGNPDEDAYALLKNTVAEGIAANRFRPGAIDADLVVQTVWAGIHGVVSLEIAKAHDEWVQWRTVKKRVAFMVDTLMAGLARR